MQEIWKDIEKFEALYQVSNLGRVKRLPRYVIDGRGRYFMPENILKSSVNNMGYRTVVLTKNHKKYTKNVHRLVADNLMPNPKNLETVNHIDGVKHNNLLSNLEWASRSDNQKHAYRLGLQTPVRSMLGVKGSDNHRSRPVIKICKDTGCEIQKYVSMTEAATANNACRSKISAVCSGSRITTGGFKWKYANGQ